MKQKILVIAALLHDPDVLIFDEPDSGLDVTSALVLRHLIASLASVPCEIVGTIVLGLLVRLPSYANRRSTRVRRRS
jgi:ABC-type transporter Mla maintaining outer membrane lipid asymmetry ATPase subunit MlaF